MDFDIKKQQLLRGLTPKDWSVCDEDGWSLAHIAAINHKLPRGFNKWDIADNKGWTVAHAAASVGKLPADFSQWLMTDDKGNTVAHIAALNGNLPETLSNDASILELTNHDGITVSQFIMTRQRVQMARCKKAIGMAQ